MINGDANYKLNETLAGFARQKVLFSFYFYYEQSME